MKQKGMTGFTLLEVVLAAFLITIILTGAFILFGSISDKAQLLLERTELRRRARYIEQLLRLDIENAKPTTQLEFYAERDGVLGPHFAPEPFADVGIDGVPNSAELGYLKSAVGGGGCSPTLYNPDPHGDDSLLVWGDQPSVTGYFAGGCTPQNFGDVVAGQVTMWNGGTKVIGTGPGVIPTPGADYTELNGILDPGEWVYDIDGNGRISGEPFVDLSLDQCGNPVPAWDPNGSQECLPSCPTGPLAPLLAPDSNYSWDFSTNLIAADCSGACTGPPFPSAGCVFEHEVFTDVDGDGIYSPRDAAIEDFRLFRSDRTPPEDNPLTFMVDESLRATDSASLFRSITGITSNFALSYEILMRSLQHLSPFGFIDWGIIEGGRTLNNNLNPGEIILYDYFPGTVNNGDQDTLYLRTQVRVGDRFVDANVYYRLVYQNADRGYLETFDDTGGYTSPRVNDINSYGVNDGIWTIGEDSYPPNGDINGNGIIDPTVNPEEIRLQRIISLPGNPVAQFQDLGPAIRFNVEYFDVAQRRFVEPFSDTGIDGLYNMQEPNGDWGINSGCRDCNLEDYYPGLNQAGTENNRILDLANNTGVPAATLNWNSYISTNVLNQYLPVPASLPFPSGAPANPGENPYFGFQRFGYPDTAGTLIYQTGWKINGFDARFPIPPLQMFEYIVAEARAIGATLAYSMLYPVNVLVCDPGFLTYPGGAMSCDPSATLSANNTLGPHINYELLTENDLNMFNFSPAGVFDEEGWLRCAGIYDNFANLRPGDEVFVWAYLIAPDKNSISTGSEPVRVPVPPGNYPIVAISGNRLLIDLSSVSGGAPTLEQLAGTPAIYRAGYLPPAFRIDFAVMNEYQPIRGTRGVIDQDRNLRFWNLIGASWVTQGIAAQGLDPSTPIYGTVLTVAPKRRG